MCWLYYGSTHISLILKKKAHALPSIVVEHTNNYYKKTKLLLIKISYTLTYYIIIRITYFGTQDLG